MQPLRVRQPSRSQITTPTGSIPNSYNRYVPPYSGPLIKASFSSVVLAILPLKNKPSKWNRIYCNNTFKCYFSSLKNFFPIGFKENLREEENLSTRDNWPVPNILIRETILQLERELQ